MDSYVDFSGQVGFQDAAEDSGDGSSQHRQFKQETASSIADQQKFYTHHMSNDIKPRLTKEQHDILESHYQKAAKPNTNTKKVFAEQLSVSLDKVNNWFQNRRAKAKQDVKKAQGAFNLLAQQQSSHYGFTADSEVSPAYSIPADYFNAMQDGGADGDIADGLGIMSQDQPFQNQNAFAGLQFNNTSGAEQFDNYNPPPHMPQDMFDSPQEVNRRTLTQEQFDVLAQQNGGMMKGAENFELFQTGYSGNQGGCSQAMLNTVFNDIEHSDFKPQGAFGYPSHAHQAMSSHGSSIPSSSSDKSMSRFTSTSSMEDHGNMSANNSEWADSLSSSLSSAQQEDPFAQISAPQQQQQSAATKPQWQPGQSVPSDIDDLQQQFFQVAQARQAPQQQQAHEQPLAWPADEAFIRRESSASMLAQSMSHVGIHTPQPQQQATFQSPAPPASIAARRQRPRPAGLHLGAVRSQSYSGSAQPGSPGQLQQQSLTPGQPLRRIRSSNVMNGVAQGRVQKSMPGSAQRSPMAWTFSEAMNSPKAIRHVSSSNLAPPTPMSPNEFPRPQVPSWQAAGHVSRQPSISESDLEYGVQFAPSASMPTQNFSSPPHTPMYHQQHFVQQRIGNNVITENTPPQSAPASQQCFPANTFSVPQPQMQPPPPPQSQAAPQHMQSFAPPHQQQFMNVIVPDQHFPSPNVTFAPSQQFTAPTSSAPPVAPPLFPHAVPMVNAHGELEMMWPQQMQFAQQVLPQAQPQPQQQAPQQQMPTPPQGQYGMFSTAGATPSLQVTASVPRQPAPQPTMELFVHEYSPPQDLKRAATPRKNPVDKGPINYIFANQGLEDFGKGKTKDAKASATASSSPASSNGAVSSS